MDSKTPEQPKSLEREPRYKKVVFGHWFHEFDRDQFLTYYFAIKAGLINKNIPICFTPKVESSDLEDSSVLVIEGIPEGMKNDLGKDKGNFDNDINSDLPATSLFFEQFRNEMGDFQKVATDINRWFSASERRREMKKPLSLLKKEDLDLATTKIFAGLKIKYKNDSEKLLKELVVLMEVLQDEGRKEELKDLYREALVINEQEVSKSYSLLEGAVKEENRFKLAATDSAVNLAYFDIRGIDASLGAPSVARAKGKELGLDPDLVFLISDAKDDEGSVVGRRLLFKFIEKEKDSKQKNKVDLRTLLMDRLQHLESLFGKGYIAEFGGHPGIIGSDRQKGSGLEPQELWFAIQNFFDKPRYTQEEFNEKSVSFAKDCVGVETVLPRATQTPGNAYELPERVMEVGLLKEANGETKIISISENDLPLYEEYFKEVLDGNVETFQTILKEKTVVSEPALIADYRALKAGVKLRELVKNPDKINKTLDALNDLNPSQVENLPPEVLEDILSAISNNENAIDLIWNKDNGRYKITAGHIPDWMRQDAEKYKAGRYTYLSLPYKIDEFLVKKVISQVLDSGDVTKIEKTGLALIGILGSKNYKESHKEAVYDQLLHSALRICTNEKLLSISNGENLAKDLMSKLVESYGKEMIQHWTFANEQYKSLFVGAQERFPFLKDVFKDLGILVEKPDNPDYQLELWSPTEVIPPENTKILESIQKQKEKSREPIVTVFVQVGRGIEDLLKKEGVYREKEDSPEKDLDIIGSVKINGYMRLGQDSSEAVQLSNLLYKYVEDITKFLHDQGENAKIRIMTGGFPGVLSRKVTAVFHQKVLEAVKAGDMASAQELVKISESLIFSDYNLQDKKFYDASFV